MQQHLGLDRAGWSTIRLRPHLERLEAAGHLQRIKHAEAVLYLIANAGAKRRQ